MPTETRIEWEPIDPPTEPGWVPRFNDYDRPSGTLWKLYTRDAPDGDVFATQRKWVEMKRIVYRREVTDWMRDE